MQEAEGRKIITGSGAWRIPVQHMARSERPAVLHREVNHSYVYSNKELQRESRWDSAQAKMLTNVSLTEGVSSG